MTEREMVAIASLDALTICLGAFRTIKNENLRKRCERIAICAAYKFMDLSRGGLEIGVEFAERSQKSVVDDIVESFPGGKWNTDDALAFSLISTLFAIYLSDLDNEEIK